MSILLIFNDGNIIIFVLRFCNSETYFYIILLSTVTTSTPLSIKRSSHSTESITRSDSEQFPLKRRCLAYETECNPIMLERYAFCMICIDFHFDEIVNVSLFMWGLVQCFIAFNLTASLCLVILCIWQLPIIKSNSITIPLTCLARQ